MREPHFSTKRDDQNFNRGLGLYMVEKIAHLHGGVVAIKSEVGSGTTVSLSVPQPE